MSPLGTNNSFQRIERNNNLLTISSLQNYYNPVAAYGLAIKYVSSGLEEYTLDKENYRVAAGMYLLTNSSNGGHVHIDSEKPVEGICINISTSLLESTIASIVRPDASLPDPDIGKFFNSSLFIENTYQASETRLGQALMHLNSGLQAGNLSIENLSAEFFYSISENIIADYTPVCRQLQYIPAVKTITKKELYKKILTGKDYIDTYFANPLTIEMIAKECCMSEYHFFRLFKLIHQVSPHQYIIRKRLECGKKMLELHQVPISTAALDCGFSDIHTFSGAFRKYFGFSPSSLLLKNSRIS